MFYIYILLFIYKYFIFLFIYKYFCFLFFHLYINNFKYIIGRSHSTQVHLPQPHHWPPLQTPAPAFLPSPFRGPLAGPPWRPFRGPAIGPLGRHGLPSNSGAPSPGPRGVHSGAPSLGRHGLPSNSGALPLDSPSVDHRSSFLLFYYILLLTH